MYRKLPPSEGRKTRLLTALLLTAVFLVTGTILLLSRNGIMAITEIQGDVDNVVAENMQLEARIDSLNTVVDLLENDSLYMEKRVREILGWGREGETVVKFMEPDTE
ncbi:MAG: septum formation initiator family protein [Candidatus Fermentibacteraceae bacterium]|nr:septum formation initiator family protein [Candidatus Fermentibacteraceae bacterium]